MVRILFLGDVFGNAGLDAVERHVPALRDELDLDLVLANGENVAGVAEDVAEEEDAHHRDRGTLGRGPASPESLPLPC